MKYSFEKRKTKGGATAFVDVGAKARLSALADKALIRRLSWGRCSVIGSGMKIQNVAVQQIVGILIGIKKINLI